MLCLHIDACPIIPICVLVALNRKAAVGDRDWAGARVCLEHSGPH